MISGKGCCSSKNELSQEEDEEKFAVAALESSLEKMMLHKDNKFD